MSHIRSAFAAAVAVVILCGCVPQTDTNLPNPPADPNPAATQSAPDRIRDLAALAAQFEANAKKLPGKTRDEDRALMAEQFALLSQMLPMLVGTEPPGDVRQQIRIVESTRTQLAQGPAELSIEPTVGAGLRGALHTLKSINLRLFTDIPKVAESLDAMRVKVDELDAVSGPIHRLTAAQAATQAADILTLMSQTLEKRLVPEPDPTTQPATQPATAPTTQPSTQPATAPAEKKPE